MQEHASVSSILPFIHLLFPYSIHVVSCFVQEFYDYSIELVNAPIFNLVLHIDYKASPSGNIVPLYRCYCRSKKSNPCGFNLKLKLCGYLIFNIHNWSSTLSHLEIIRQFWVFTIRWELNLKLIMILDLYFYRTVVNIDLIQYT